MAILESMAELSISETFLSIGNSPYRYEFPQNVTIIGNWGINDNSIVIVGGSQTSIVNADTYVEFGSLQMYPPSIRLFNDPDSLFVTIEPRNYGESRNYCYAAEIYLTRLPDSLSYEGSGSFTMAYNPKANVSPSFENTAQAKFPYLKSNPVDLGYGETAKRVFLRGSIGPLNNTENTMLIKVWLVDQDDPTYRNLLTVFEHVYTPTLSHEIFPIKSTDINPTIPNGSITPPIDSTTIRGIFRDVQVITDKRARNDYFIGRGDQRYQFIQNYEFSYATFSNNYYLYPPVSSSTTTTTTATATTTATSIVNNSLYAINGGISLGDQTGSITTNSYSQNVYALLCVKWTASWEYKAQPIYNSSGVQIGIQGMYLPTIYYGVHNYKTYYRMTGHVDWSYDEVLMQGYPINSLNITGKLITEDGIGIYPETDKYLTASNAASTPFVSDEIIASAPILATYPVPPITWVDNRGQLLSSGGSQKDTLKMIDEDTKNVNIILSYLFYMPSVGSVSPTFIETTIIQGYPYLIRSINVIINETGPPTTVTNWLANSNINNLRSEITTASSSVSSSSSDFTIGSVMQNYTLRGGYPFLAYPSIDDGSLSLFRPLAPELRTVSLSNKIIFMSESDFNQATQGLVGYAL